MAKVIPYLRLMRPANIVTAVADICAGFAISQVGLFQTSDIFRLILLIIATKGLYGGGVVLNDVFDAQLDKSERPERPIPSGQVSVRQASVLAAGLFLMAFIAAFSAGYISGIIAIAIAGAAIFYDKLAKHHVFLGPVVMGTCRALNLLLGISASADAVAQFWPFVIIPLVFIAAVTLLSQGEVHGSNRINLILSGALFFLVFTLLNTLPVSAGKQITFSFPLSVLFLVFVMIPFINAFRSGQPQDVRKAVKAGILSLVIMDATIAVPFSGLFPGLLILLLLPLSVLLAKTFAVT
jgi:4-hydroxybenzoate polyprenyltransferase